jgi:hypothetical protein
MKKVSKDTSKSTWTTSELSAEVDCGFNSIFMGRPPKE